MMFFKKMMRRIPCAAMAMMLSGCSEPEAFDGRRALAEVEALVRIAPRDAGTGGARRAAVHLQTRLKEMGVEDAEIDTFSEETPHGKMFFHNVIGRLPGSSVRLIVIASHFDTKSGIAPDFQGANDSGSSSGALLELARVLAARGPHETGFLFAFFDGEECRTQYGPHDGLHGSRHLARQMAAQGKARNVEAVIVLDMVGDRDLNITVPRNCSRSLVKTLFSAAHDLGVRHKFSLYGADILDDHVPFLANGMPAVNLIDFEYGSAPGLNDYWHTTNDTLDKLSVDSLQITGDVILRMVEKLQ